MMRVLRIAAILTAIAAVIDPVFAGRRQAPLTLDVRLPQSGDTNFGAASRLRDAFLGALGNGVRVNGSEPAPAVIAIGNAALDSVPRVPVFWLRAPADTGVTAVAAPPVSALWGQQPRVSASFRAQGVRDRITTFKLTGPAGAVLGSVQHRWTIDDEAFESSFPYAPAAPGLALLRITAETDGMARVPVDVPVRTTDRRVRVLVFEPRPSWASGFARQAIESDSLFDVRALARTSRGVTAQTPGAPASLAALALDDTDAILVGGLDALSEQDLAVLRRFAEERGGSVVLIPDARVPENVRAAFDLPGLTESLVERPAELRQGDTRVLATELLRVPGREAASVRDALFATPRGRGSVLVALGIDAWRQRGEPEGFTKFWRAVAAESAMAAPAAATVALEPAVARPGDEVGITVHVRVPAEDTNGSVRVPSARGALVGSNGEMQPFRLWPGTTAGEYVGRLVASAPGRYDIRVDLEGLPRQDAVLVVNVDAARPARNRDAQLAFLAEATGGAVLGADEIPRLLDILRALPSAEESRQVRPTRSAWWMLGFVALLNVEWAMRRRQGLP